MARRGKFGRLPRSAPDLSSTIVAILREYQSQRDRNIQQAWENGGEFEGSPVTDQRILDHWRMRVSEVSEDDPLYDTYKQGVFNMEFTIANSKQELGYAEKKYNDTQMAAFYRSWAGKHPVQSEAWRKMMTLAAQYAERAKAEAARGRGGGGGGRSRSTAVIRDAGRKELGFNTLKDLYVQLAVSRGILNTEKEDLTDLRAYESDSTRLLELVNEFATAPEWAATREAYTDYIRQYGDPNFNGDFSYTGWAQMRTALLDGITARLKVAQREGSRTDVKAVTKELQEAAAFGLRVALIDEVQTYEESRAAWEANVSDPNATPIDKMAATLDYQRTIGSLYRRAQDERAGQVSASTVEGHLYNELLALNGQEVNGPTLWDDSRGTVAAAASDPQGGDAYGTSSFVRTLSEELNQLLTVNENGQAAYVMVRVNDAGQPVPTGGEIRVAPVSALPANTGFVVGHGTPTLTLNVATGGTTTFRTDGMLTAVVGTPVLARGYIVDEVGRTVGAAAQDATRSDEVGMVYTMPDNSLVYGYYDANGTRRYSTVSPFSVEPKRVSPNAYEAEVLFGPGQQLPPTGFDPTVAFDQNYYTLPEAQTATVFKSAFTAWMMGGAKDSRALISTSDSTITSALLAESGGDMARFTEMYNEADSYRADYINNTPLAQTQYQQSFLRGITAPRFTRTGDYTTARTEQAIARAVQVARLGEEDERRIADLAPRPGQPGSVGGYSELEMRNRAAQMLGVTPTATTVIGAEGAFRENMVRTAAPAALANYVRAETGRELDYVLGARKPVYGPPAPTPTKPPLYGPPAPMAAPAPSPKPTTQPPLTPGAPVITAPPPVTPAPTPAPPSGYVDPATGRWVSAPVAPAPPPISSGGYKPGGSIAV
jgi:hypothetical protein